MTAAPPSVPCWTLVNQIDATETPSVSELKTALENGNDEVKIETMRHILIIMLNGESMPQLLMHVIRFVSIRSL